MAHQAAQPGDQTTNKALRELGCGRTVGRYTILRRIAAGGMAEVYVAQSRGISGFEKRVAIKKILPQHSHNERFIDMLVDEAKITVSITHPNIAQVYELGLDGEDYFIVMEYVEGRPLNRLMQRVDERGFDTIQVDHAAHVMGEVAQGLDHAHNQRDQKGKPLGIVHRDVSPQNVLISYDGSVKLIDFGIARAEGRINQTSHGVIKGKLRYLAPEIAAGEEPDHRADVFCCGIVLFEMLTGEAMFAPKSDMEAIELATEARVKSPRSRNRKVPQDLDDIVMKALRRDRNERYQHCRELHADLRRFLNQTFPAFVGSELGDFMKRMFTVEISEERKLDEAAERLAQRVALDEDEEDPTLAASPGDLVGPLPGDRKEYRQIVTRLGIPDGRASMKLVGADGGRAMAVVPADPEERPPIQGASEELEAPGTMPPQQGPGAASPTTIDHEEGSWTGAAEPTVRADNPFVRGSSSVLPTITGPPPEDPSDTVPKPSSIALKETHDKDAPKVEVQARTASLHVWEERESQVMVTPRAETARPTDVLDPVALSGLHQLNRRRQIGRVLFAAGGVLIAAMLAVLLFGPKRGDRVVIPAEDDTITMAPVSITEPPPPTAGARIAPASVVLDVTPQVRVDVEVDGRRVRTSAVTPVEIEGLLAGQVHRIRVSAAGYVSEEMSRTLAPGSRTSMEISLRAATGTIILSNVTGRIHASHGTVRKNRIVNIQLDTKVDLRVDRPGAHPWRDTVYIKDEVARRIRVPAPKYKPKGTLIVNTRPVSTVYVNGKNQGKTPVKVRVLPGKHRIVLKSPTGKTKKFRRQVSAGRTTTFTYNWQ